MQNVILIMFLCVTVAEFIVGALGLPNLLRFLPEMMSAILVVYVIFAGTRDRFRLVAPKYWVAYGALAVVMLCGIVNNPSGTGPMMSAGRFFLRAVPLFFLPAVLPQTEGQIKRQFQWLLGLSLLQVPVAIYQRWVILDAERYSGDDVRGTVMDSGILSMFEICAVLVLTGLLLKGRIGKLMYGILFVFLLIPTAIDETKATVVLLPLGLFATLITGAEPRKRLQYAGLGLVGVVVFLALFVPIYNKMEENNPYKAQRDITNYISNEKNLNRYMTSNVGGVGTKLDVRRGDAIMVPLEYLAKDPVTLAFGLGLGSVSPSIFGKNFEGPYFGLFQKFVITSFTYFVLQVGVFGVAAIAVLFWLVFRDSLAVAHHDGTLIGAIAAGWTGVVALFCIATLYDIYHEFSSVTYLYGYISGLICARRVELNDGAGRNRGR